MPAAIVDLSGKRFGKLTVVKPLKKRSKSGGVFWRCNCECGRNADVVSGNLQSEATKSCGRCLSRAVDIAGQTFADGDVTALRPKGTNKHGKRLWECRCNRCRRKFVTTASALRSRTTKSCGCLPNCRPHDLTGKRFGDLTAKKVMKKRNKFGHVLWLCECECGRSKVVPAHELVAEKVKSCGFFLPRIWRKRDCKREWAEKEELILDGELHYSVGKAARYLGIWTNTFHKSTRRVGWFIACPWLGGAGVPYQLACGAWNREIPYIAKRVLNTIQDARAAAHVVPDVPAHTYVKTFIEYATRALRKSETTIRLMLGDAGVTIAKYPAKDGANVLRRRAYVPNVGYAALGLEPPASSTLGQADAAATPPSSPASAAPTGSAGATGTPAADPGEVLELTRTEQRILDLCEQARTGERIAHHLDLTHDHTRHVCAKLCRLGLLRSTEEGYRKV